MLYKVDEKAPAFHARLVEFRFLSITEAPINFEGICSSNAKFWEKTIKIGIDSIIKNKTWIFSDLPLDAKSIGCKWIF